MQKARIPVKRRELKAGLLNNLSWVLSTSPKDDIRDGKRSIELAAYLGVRRCLPVVPINLNQPEIVCAAESIPGSVPNYPLLDCRLRTRASRQAM